MSPVALVTGATSGIGLAEARAFAERGYRVLTCSRSKAPAGLDHVAADLATPDWALYLADEVRRRYGRLDVLVASAGGSRPFAKAILDTTNDDWRGMLGANLDVTFYCIRELAPLIVESGGGVMVTTSSVHALSGGRLRLGTYAAAKAAVIA